MAVSVIYLIYFYLLRYGLETPLNIWIFPISVLINSVNFQLRIINSHKLVHMSPEEADSSCWVKVIIYLLSIFYICFALLNFIYIIAKDTSSYEFGQGFDMFITWSFPTLIISFTIILGMIVLEYEIQKQEDNANQELNNANQEQDNPQSHTD